MFSWMRRRRGATLALMACSALLVGSLVAPAFGAPSAISVAKKALKTSKAANKRSKRAVKTARKALKKAKRGPAGITGPTGPRGLAGTDGFGELLYGFNSADAVVDGTADAVGVECPSGTYPTGGDAGANTSSDTSIPEASVITQQAIAIGPDGPFGYYADYDNETGHDVDVFVDVVCANADQIAPASTSRRYRGTRQMRRHSRIFTR